MGDRPTPSGRTRGEPERAPLAAAVLTSGPAPGVERLLRRGGRPGGPYRVAGLVASDAGAESLSAAEAAGVPAVVHDPVAFCDRRGTSTEDRRARVAFDRALVRRLDRMGAEAVVLCGYRWIATEPLLEAFPGRVFNVHDADLTVLGEDGLPRYRGLRSTRDALRDGATETRSTVHLATERVDVGPPLLLSRPFPVHPMVERAREWEADDLLSAYAYAHRGWMMRACWGELLDRALELEARGLIERSGDRVLVDGEPAPLRPDGAMEQPAPAVSDARTCRAARVPGTALPAGPTPRRAGGTR